MRPDVDFLASSCARPAGRSPRYAVHAHRNHQRRRADGRRERSPRAWLEDEREEDPTFEGTDNAFLAYSLAASNLKS